jgi:Flp pilus assembly protein CpaB
MAEDKPTVKNVGLLAAAGIIGALVVVVYVWHIAQVRKAGRGETVQLLEFARDMDAGEAVGVEDLNVITVETSIAKGLGNVVRKSRDEVRGYALNQPVQRGAFLQWSQILGQQGHGPSSAIRRGMEAFTVAIESRTAPGMILNVGDRIALLGKLRVRGGPLKTHRLIEGVRVLAIGGVTTGGDGANPGIRRRVQRSYRNLTMEVTPEVANQLADVMSHLQDLPQVVVLSPHEDSRRFPDRPQVPEELRALGASPGPGAPDDADLP